MCDRTLNWQPLQRWEDPVPGCPQQVDALADDLQAIADRITGEVTVLEEIERESDDPDVWASDAADRFLDLQRELRPPLTTLAERYQVAARALSDYAIELRIAQDESEDALRSAEAARDQMDEAKLGIEQMELAQESGDDWSGPDPHEAQADAQARLERALADLDQAIRRRDQAAELAASAIARHIEGDGLQNPTPGSQAALADMIERLQADPSLWAYLSAEDRALLIERYPEIIGNMDGIPSVDRDAANRLYMAETRTELEARRAELLADNADGRHDEAIEAIDRQLAGIGVIEDRLASAPGGREAYLLGFSPEPNGRAIVAIGNPDTADNVLTYVPGTGSELSGSLRSDIRRVDTMAEDAYALDENADTATIMWLGYDAPPEIPDARHSHYAENGAGTLRDFQDGLATTHVDGGAHYTVLGHSYGSTVIGHAASGGDLNADNLVFVGSPGVGVDHVSDLGIDPDRVYASNAFHDPVGYTPGMVHGPPPTRDSFGATEFRSDPGAISLDTHSSYWDDGNQFRDSVAAIATGNHDQVSLGRETPGWYDVVDVGSHVDTLGEVAGDVRDRVGDAAGEVRDRVGDAVSDGRDWVEERLPWNR